MALTKTPIAMLDATGTAGSGNFLRGDGSWSAAGITAMTVQNSTSGTSIDFTSIPAGVKRVTVLLNGVSLSGTAMILIQAGISSGVVTSGYAGAMALAGNAAATQAVALSNGVQVYGLVAAQAASGSIRFELISGSTWIISGTTGIHAIPYAASIGGTITLGGVLDRIRITTTNGTDTFDAGSINVFYE